MSILPKFLPRNDYQRNADAERQLIRSETQFGSKIFGPIPKNHKREFFCLDEYTWIWHEDWKDKSGQQVINSTRYILRPDGPIKSVNGRTYQRLSSDEALNLYQAIKKYVRLAENHYALMAQA